MFYIALLRYCVYCVARLGFAVARLFFFCVMIAS